MNKFFQIVFAFIFLTSFAYALPYDYSSTESVPVKISILEKISTKNMPIEGQTVKFKVFDNVFYKNRIAIKKGEIITAKIETTITSGMNGFPAEIIIDDFEIPGIDNSRIVGTINKKGQNRCLWVYPLKWSLTMIPFAGSLTNLIKGGHVAVTPEDIITIYYYPEWL